MPDRAGRDLGGPGRPDPGDPAPQRLRRTPVRVLVVAALFGGLAGWLIVLTTGLFNADPPLVPWSAPIALIVAAVVAGGLAWAVHQRIQVRRERVDPQHAVIYLAMAKAAALVGALVAGGYLGFALMFVGRFDAELPRERVIRSLVAIVAGIGLMIAGLRLERACEVPGYEDEDDDDRADGRPGSRGEPRNE